MRTLFFASVAHDLKTPINAVLGTNATLETVIQEDMAKNMLSV